MQSVTCSMRAVHAAAAQNCTGFPGSHSIGVLRQVPVTFMYGEHDWMDPAGAHRAAVGMAERRAAAGPGDQQVITVKVGMHSTH